MTKSEISVLRYCFGYVTSEGKTWLPRLLIVQSGCRLHRAAEQLARHGLIMIHGMGPLSKDVRIVAAVNDDPPTATKLGDETMTDTLYIEEFEGSFELCTKHANGVVAVHDQFETREQAEEALRMELDAEKADAERWHHVQCGQ